MFDLILKYLFKKDAIGLENVILKNNINVETLNTIMEKIYSHGDTDIYEILIKHGANNFDECLYKVYNNKRDLKIAKYMIEKGATIDGTFKDEDVIELLYMGLELKNIKFHQIHTKMIYLYIETAKHLPLPKELINIVNSYQII